MSGHQYVPNPANLFTDEDDIDDELFLRNAHRADAYLPAEDKYGVSKVSGAVYTRPDVLGPAAGYEVTGGGLAYAGSSGSAGGGSVVSVGPGGYVMDMPAAAAYGGYGAGVPSKPLVYGSGANVYSSLGPDEDDVAVDDEIARQRQTFEQRRRELEESTLLTSQRCLGVLRETEQVGIATAEELHRQREQLEKTKKQLDEINNSLRFSQKHLNSLKSVFGGLKNYLSGRMVAGGGGAVGPVAGPGSVHGDHGMTTAGGIPRQNISSPTPTEEDDLYPNPQDFRIADPYWNADQSPVPPPQGPGDYHHHHHPHHPHHPQHLHQQQKQQQQQQLANGGAGAGTAGGFSHQLDQNLDEMRGNLSRLKNLALDLNQEIDSQNDLIDDISDRVEDVDVKIGKQNKDMNRLMRK
ncbi:synaptosomal-associated protein 29 [Anopheles nili]|uniref:synaptosomal-associated protein 29 n=1 Tax=Anopheles nili TaxID=185578 RepID=UPI00237A0D63|nr:synaptosomal-associated protein 29 [Anopheles nili]